MDIFESIINNNTVTFGTFMICIFSALVAGFGFSWMCYYKSHSSKSFFVATSLLPACVALVIMFVNREIGTGVAIAGAFSLVRFRSMPGSAKEIATIFVDMAMGLAFGMGYIAYGVLFGLIVGVVLIIFARTNLWDKSNKTYEKILKITIPEDLDYCNIFRPDAIVLGGGISKEGRYLTDKIVKYLDNHDYGYPGSPRSEILTATLGNNAGIIGAASLIAEGDFE